MIEWVLLGQRWNPEGSDELKWGWQALQRQLPAQAKVVQTQATNAEELWQAAVELMQAQGAELTDASLVLLLAHPHLALAPGTLPALVAACAANDIAPANSTQVNCAFDSQHSHPLHPVNYCTWRGLEHYAASLQSDTAVMVADPTSPLVKLVSARALQTGGALSEAPHWALPKAFAHDYANYRSSDRSDMLRMVPADVRNILDVGGGEGGFLELVKQSRQCQTHLAEFSAQACEVARGRVDHVWQGDFFTTAIEGTFDCISFLDVLEHTIDPLSWLQRARQLLAPGGVVITSIPNVGHWSVVADLLEGRWDYAPVGIHCITHLRFFTRHGIEDLFAQAGFAIDSIEATVLPPPPWWNLAGLQDATSNMLDIQADKLNAYAYAVRARVI